MPIPQRRPDSPRPRDAGYLLFALAGVLALFTASSLAGGGGRWGAVQFWLAGVTAALVALGVWRRRPAGAPSRSVRQRLRQAARLHRPRRPSAPEPAPTPADQPAALVGTIVGLDTDGTGDA
jgi:hypothetical protein